MLSSGLSVWSNPAFSNNWSYTGIAFQQTLSGLAGLLGTVYLNRAIDKADLVPQILRNGSMPHQHPAPGQCLVR
jgi:hypothetical protein